MDKIKKGHQIEFLVHNSTFPPLQKTIQKALQTIKSSFSQDWVENSKEDFLNQADKFIRRSL